MAPSENRKAPMKKAPPDMSVFLLKNCTPPRINTTVEANLMHVKTPDAIREEFCPLCKSERQQYDYKLGVIGVNAHV